MGFFDKFKFKRLAKNKLKELVKKGAGNLTTEINNGSQYSSNISSTFYQFNSGGGSSGNHWDHSLDCLGYNSYANNFTIMQRAREACFDQPSANSLVTRKVDIVVNTGITIVPIPDWEAIGITKEEAREWSRPIEKRFNRWALSKEVSRDWQNNFYQLQRMALTGQIRDGEYFVRFYYSKNQKLQNPLQLQIIDPNQINGTGIVTTIGDNAMYTVGDGINRDEGGKEIEYSVIVWDYKKHESKIVIVPAAGPKSKRVMMIHGFRQVYPGQGRGLSEIFSSLQWLQKITDLSDAEIQRAIIQASIALYVKPPEDRPAGNPLTSVKTSFNSDDEEPEENIDSCNGISYNNIGHDILKAPGIGVFGLQAGEDLKSLDFNRAAADFVAFRNSIMQILASSSGMPLEVLEMNFKNNYSASQGAIILAYQIAKQWIMELVSDLLSHVYEMWLVGEIAAGRAACPGWNDPRIKAAWLNASWVGNPIPAIDKLKEAKARLENINLGLTTRERESRNLNGSNFDDNAARLQEENEKMKSNDNTDQLLEFDIGDIDNE